MKITIIHGQSHKGSTYHIARILAEKLDGDITEFFLPKDFQGYCVGCTNCILKDEKLCPHYQNLSPITKSIDDADVLIFESPVYVYHVTGAMKSFLDHYGYRWMVHRPQQSMFHKQAVCISTAAGAGTKSTNKDMADSFFFWGISKIYKLGFAVRAVNWDNVSPKIKMKIDDETSKTANKILNNFGKVKSSFKTKAFFNLMRSLQKKGWNKADIDYWNEKEWNKKARPWK